MRGRSDLLPAGNLEESQRRNSVRVVIWLFKIDGKDRGGMMTIRIRRACFLTVHVIVLCAWLSLPS